VDTPDEAIMPRGVSNDEAKAASVHGRVQTGDGPVGSGG
jgi:hypothetical protein